AFDINLGCSAYPYGLWLMSQLISAGQMRRGLLLVGDTLSRKVSPQDSATAYLFGDSGTATAIEFDPAAPEMNFVLGTDGRGASHLIVPAGEYRQPRDALSSQRTTRADGGLRSDEDLSMNGPEVFAFTLREVPTLAQQTLSAAGWTLDGVDAVVMHQANTFMLTHLAKRLKLPKEKMPLSLREFGNTSCSSIPVTMAACLNDALTASPQKLMLLGFGVGFSWAGAALTCGPLACADVIRVGHVSNVPVSETGHVENVPHVRRAA
ncbi:MAG TPA: 3-oxoacyl-[acyl-carrier-protein] synthase III C-terminal domain-containing protein, partial [Planctomycetaceae bacterium]|nr:3-oxoacyl-[acyl-carrier-protein] synthase III C-terminal domain-containing protein [Planctomycetaceae bacterium]